MKKVIRQLIGIGIMALILVSLVIIRNIPEAADFYVLNISCNYIMVMGTLTSVFPFDLYEILLIGVIVFFAFLVIRLIVTLIKCFSHKNWILLLQRFVQIIYCALLCITYYYATASVAYGRSPVDIPQYNETVTPELITDALVYYVDQYNELGTHFERYEDHTIKMPMTHDEVFKQVEIEYKKLNSKSDYYSNFTPKVKRLLFSKVFTEFHITGVTLGITGEATINDDLHAIEYPFTMAHELAHIKGTYREDEANLVALYICINSDNDYLRYSGYYWSIFSLIDAYQTTFMKPYYEAKSLSQDVVLEINEIYDYYQKHDALAKLGNWWNNLFLKANGNENGTDDYTDTSEKEDTGETDDDGNKIYIITEFSPFLKLLYYTYTNL